MTKRALVILVILAAGLSAQANRQVVLSWTASPTPGATYNVYRAPTACGPTLAFTKVNTAPVAAVTFSDSVPAGTYCYQVTASAAGLESAPSNNAAAAVGPLPPSGLTITIAVAVDVNINGTTVAQRRFDVHVPE